MEQTVKTAKVNESAEACKGLYNTLNNIADLDCGEELLLVFLDLVFKIITSGNNALEFASAVELFNDEIIYKSDETFRILCSDNVSL